MRNQQFYLGIYFSLLIGCSTALAFTELAGDLPNEVTAANSPYLVVADIFVPTGKTVRIAPGTVFLFNNFTGLHIQGVLTAHGSVANPIIFTSANDHTYSKKDDRNPTPYDWNGIYIQKDGMGTEMEHFKVLYSVKGIVSETKFINLKSGVFKENGRSHCTIEGAEQKVVAGKPFSHAVSLKDATIDGVPIKILKDPQADKRNTLRYGGLAFLVGGMALGGYYGIEYRDSRSEFEEFQSSDTSNILYNSKEDWKAARLKRNRDLAGALAGAVLALVGSVGFIWTFTF